MISRSLKQFPEDADLPTLSDVSFTSVVPMKDERMFLSSTDLSYFHPPNLIILSRRIKIIIINIILNGKRQNISSFIITVLESMVESCSYLWPKYFKKLISKYA